MNIDYRSGWSFDYAMAREAYWQAKVDALTTQIEELEEQSAFNASASKEHMDRYLRERDEAWAQIEELEQWREAWKLDSANEAARAEKAERALGEIKISEPDWAKGVDENCETLRSIARAALRPSEKASDE